MSAAAALPITRMCLAAGVGRAGYYRRQAPVRLPAGVMELRDELQKLATTWPSYGSRRLAMELKRQGWEVNRKRVQRLMREDNLLCLQQRKFVLTTDSNHGLAVYPNLAAGMKPSRLDQLWIADITYIRLETEFIYLAVILDALSRRVVGWALDRNIDSALVVSALRMALARRQPGPGLIHHSDRGVQYASGDYVALLVEHGVQISMSRKGNPYDNAKAESFMKTLKHEEVYCTEYQGLADARDRIGKFLERIYNGRRLHSALGYVPPVEFERNLPLPPNNNEEAASRQLSL